MENSGERRDTVTHVNEVKDRVRSLRAEANRAYAELKLRVDQRNALNRDISVFINEAKNLRSERDVLTSEVKQKKGEQGGLVYQIKSKIDTARGLGNNSKGVGNVFRLKREIDRLNRKIETEVISFEKEKQLMKVINSLKKEYDAAKRARGVFEKKKEVSSEINVIKDLSEKLHGEIRDKAKLSQDAHEKSVELSKKIDALIKDVDVINAAISEKGKHVDELRVQIDESVKELNQVSAMIEKDKESIHALKEQRVKRTLSEKRAEVEAKIKKGEKLTTQDLIVMQSGD